MTTRTVAVNFTANVAPYVAGVNRANAATTGLGTRAGVASKGLTGMAKAALGPSLALAGPAGLVMAMKSAVTASLEFEDEMTKLRTQIGLASDEVDQFRKAALSLGGETTKGPQELAEASFFIASAGLRGAAALDVLRSSAQLSAIGLGETAVVADVLTSAVNAYGEETLSAASASDVLVNAVRLGKASADELAGALGKVLPIASALGARFDEVGGIVAAMTKTGTDAATATTQLRAMLVSILKPAQEAELALREFGLSGAELRATIQEDGLWAALMDMHEAVGDNAAAYGRIFPNVRALAGVMDLLGPQLEGNRELMDEMANSTGVAEDAFLDFSTTTRAELDALGAATDRVLIQAGGRTSGFVYQMTRAFRNLATSVGDVFERNEDAAGFTRDRMREAAVAMGEMRRMTAGLSGEQLDAARAASDYQHQLGILNDALGRIDSVTRASLIGKELYQNQMRALIGTEELNVEALDRALRGYRVNEEAVGAIERGLLEAAEAQEASTDATEDGTLATELATVALEDYLTALDAALDAHNRAVDPIRDAIEAQVDYVEALDEVTRLQGEGKTGTVEFRDAMLDLVDAEGDLRYALGQAGVTFGEFVSQYLDPAIERLGLADDEAQALRDAFGGIGQDLDGIDVGPFLQRMDYLIGTQDDLQGAFAESGLSAEAFKEDVLLKLYREGQLPLDRFMDLIREVNGFDDALDEIDGRQTQSEHVHVERTIRVEGPGEVPGLGLAGVRARGGPVDAGRAYLVGESGPELMVPAVSGTILNAAQMAASGIGGGGGIRIENYNTFRDVDDDLLLAKLEWAQERGRL